MDDLEKLKATVAIDAARVEAAQDKLKDSHQAIADALANSQAWDRATVLTLSLAILVFGLIILALITFLIMRKTEPGFVLRAFALPLIIISALFLVVSGFSQQQIAPVIGLLGTVAGYLLGKTSDREPPSPRPSPAPPPGPERPIAPTPPPVAQPPAG
jgi:hypothetical protein